MFISDFPFKYDPDSVQKKLIPKDEAEIVNATLPFIAVGIPRCGSSTLNYHLRRELCRSAPVSDPEPSCHHLKIENIGELLSLTRLERYFSFAICRNPYDRLVSLYLEMYYNRGGKNIVMQYSKLTTKNETIFHKSKGNFDFFCELLLDSNEWLNDIHFRPQVEFICIKDKLALDYLGKFEEYDESITEIFNVLGINYEPNGAWKQSSYSKKNWRSFYSRTSLRICESIYKDDFDFLGYSPIK